MDNSTTNQNNVEEIISQSAEEIKNEVENKSEIVFIDVEKLHPHGDNPRKDVGDVSELADSIKKNGILQNLTVVPASGYWYGDYIVIIGHRRLAAAKQAGLKEVPCIVREMTPKEQVATMLLENMQRSDLTVYEQAQGMQMMLDLGETVESVSEKTGFSQSTIRKRTRLMKLDQDIFKETEGRQVSMMEYDKLFAIQDEERRNNVLKSIGTNNFNKELQEAIEKEEKAVQRAEFIKALEENAQKTDNISNMRYAGWVNTAEALQELKKSIPEGTQLYYTDSDGYYTSLYRDYTDDEKAENEKRIAEREARDRAEQTRRERTAQLDEIAKRAFKLRKNFVKECGGLKNHLSDIVTFMMSITLFQGWCRIDADDMAELLDIDIESMDSEEKAFEALMTDVKKTPERILLIAAYVISDDDNDECYYNYDSEYEPNEKLDLIYDMLIKIGYEMSDEEKAMRDGTHELYIKSNEENEEDTEC